MRDINVLDCSLREAPIDKLLFGNDVIKKFYKDLVDVGIDIIEVGFLKNPEHIDGSTIFEHVEEIEELLPKDRKNSLFFALVDYGRYDVEKLSEYNGKSIDGIRICFKKNEYKKVIPYAQSIKDKGYKISIQQVDTISYNDMEILSFIESVNKLQPFSYSIVDTFGSMCLDDLSHIFNLVHYNLDENIVFGFHSHNNLQLSHALCQEFIRLCRGKRKAVIDGAIYGIGRGAGNANTELLIHFLNTKYSCDYDLPKLLDVIDENIPVFLQKCSYGYSIPYFIAGLCGTHVYSVNYLYDRHSILSRDLLNIVKSLDSEKKKMYHYDYLDDVYLNYFNNTVDDKETLEDIKSIVSGKNILLLAPGASVEREKELIEKYINDNNPIIITLNWQGGSFSNVSLNLYTNTKRYSRYIDAIDTNCRDNVILTSNVSSEVRTKDEKIINYIDYVMTGYSYFDTSLIVALRLLIRLKAKSIALAGVDGYGLNNNYIDRSMELGNKLLKYKKINDELKAMLEKIKEELPNDMTIKFITKSKFSNIFEEVEK